MLCKKYMNPVFTACYDGNVAAGLQPYVPEIWAQESVAILIENMGVTNLVHRDFQNEVAKFGDLVHTRQPGQFKVKRRSDSTVAANMPQAATATDIQVPLNQWFNETFIIPEGAMSLSFKELVATFLQPAVLSIARGVDRAVLGRAAVAFMGSDPSKRAGRLGNLTRESAYDAVVDCDQILNTNKAPAENRSLLLAPNSKAAMLKVDTFVQAMKRGDGGSTLETAILGQVLGFDTYMFQNVNSVLAGCDYVQFNLDATGEAAGYAGVIAAAAISTTATVGEYCVIAGNDQPTYLTNKANSTSLTLNEPLKYDVQASAMVTRYAKCQANATYAAGYAEDIVVKSFSAGKPPAVGQLVAFDADGSHRHTYTVIESTLAIGGATCAILLDRPLEITVSANDSVFPGPMGTINVAMHKNALALVTRPLATTHAAGIEFGVQEDYGIGMRVAMQHLINQGLVVSVDLLAGVAVLNANLGVPLLG